ncbi:helix-turn-helix domain-containing protein [Streptomyces sp. Rer75]|uniref:helix-turn-helix domain-containing protein n=1 Tax=unclassified Streptomyces TaxID=2593676 RepID=UPI0015CFF401|nr:helix-turn-helix transcriptional regulator [Streptomyces sp. Rer75]QLH21031.1 helix-turn-helix domain-containing protein [Streptomyces sp. Rer75]
MEVSSSRTEDRGPLAGFLRARREQVRPEQHRLVSGAKRQVPGLRRDEVALLAGVSTDYYVRLEQGRERRPSRTVLEGLREALLLDSAAARYLRGLAESGAGMNDAGDGRPDRAQPGMGRERLESVYRLLSTVTVPALLVNRRLDIVGDNALGDLLHEGLDPRDNYARMVFCAPQARTFFTEWPDLARCMVAALRAQTGPAHTGSEADADGLAGLVDELAAHSEDFSTAWAEHHVYEKAMDHKRLRHPRVGPLHLDQHTLELPGSGGHKIWTYHPADAATTEALRQLAA